MQGVQASGTNDGVVPPHGQSLRPPKRIPMNRETPQPPSLYPNNVKVDKPQKKGRTTYGNVSFQNESGRLTLTPSGIAFDAAEDDGTESVDSGRLSYHVPWTAMKKYRLNGSKEPEALIRLTTSANYGEGDEEETSLFQLSSREELESLGEDIEGYLRQPKMESDHTETTADISFSNSSVSSISNSEAPSHRHVIPSTPRDHDSLVMLVYDYLLSAPEETKRRFAEGIVAEQPGRVLRAIQERERQQDSSSPSNSSPAFRHRDDRGHPSSPPRIDRLPKLTCVIEGMESAAMDSDNSFSKRGARLEGDLERNQDQGCQQEDNNSMAFHSAVAEHSLNGNTRPMRTCVNEHTVDSSSKKRAIWRGDLERMRDFDQHQEDDNSISFQSAMAEPSLSQHTLVSTASVKEPGLLAGVENSAPRTSGCSTGTNNHDVARDMHQLARRLDEQDRQAKQRSSEASPRAGTRRPCINKGVELRCSDERDRDQAGQQGNDQTDNTEHAQLKREIIEHLKQQPTVPGAHRVGDDMEASSEAQCEATREPEYNINDGLLIEAYLVAQESVSCVPKAPSEGTRSETSIEREQKAFWELSEVEFLDAVNAIMKTKSSEPVPDEDIDAVVAAVARTVDNSSRKEPAVADKKRSMAVVARAEVEPPKPQQMERPIATTAIPDQSTPATVSPPPPSYSSTNPETEDACCCL